MERGGGTQAAVGNPEGPRASVVIPTFNRCDLVCEAVVSVLRQTLCDTEVIVVDDGSTDGTAQALAVLFGEEPRVRIIRQENGGTASARNRGLAHVRTRYVGFLDSDDLWEPAYLASQIARLEAEQADAVLCDVAYQGWDRGADHLFADPDFLAPLDLEAMLAGAWGLPTGLLCRAEIAHGLGFDESFRYSEDTEFLFRFQAAGHRLVLNEECLALLRHHGEGRKSDDRRVEHRAARVRMLRRHAHRASVRRFIEHEIYTLNRVVAREFVEAGRWHEARPHLAACALRHPYRPRVVGRWLRSLLASPATQAAPGASVQRAAAVSAVTR